MPIFGKINVNVPFYVHKSYIYVHNGTDFNQDNDTKRGVSYMYGNYEQKTKLIVELDEEQTKHRWAEDFLVNYRMAS